MKRKDRPETSPQPLATSTAERIGAIVEAAERAAVAVIDDAENQARRHLEEAQAEAERIVSDRLAGLSRLTDSLVAQAEATKGESEKLVAMLEEAKRRIAAGQDLEGEDEGGESAEPTRGSHLSAVGPAEAAEANDGLPGQGTPAGARLLATQMAVSGSTREEIEARLRNGFDIEDTGAILDAILGPED
jgi:vacuolar-type H+-ATPase subunit H